MSGAAVGMGSSRASIERSRRTLTFFIHAILIAGGIIVMIPLAWMLSTSLKPPHQITKFPPIWIPDPFVWSNYVRAVTIFPVSFVVFVRNSMYMSLMITLGTVLSNAVVAFAFARLTFRGSRVLFIIVLSTMMLPQQVTMIPLFILFSKFGWINTYNPLIVPHFFANAYFVFLLRQFYTTIPRELDDAARIDGCGVIGLFLRIMLPLSKPALGITAIFAFTWAWNEFLGPLIYLSRMETFPLAIALSFLRAAHGVLWSELMVVSFIAMLPPVILFFVAQKHYIQGIVITGVKG
ncbi:MAG: carbohydrate ABC transporter permease [Caldilineaceae bacterium SB0664_bin_27]|uniref:Carbohydrate ABC transporter permease n=1 Tax=Caldilineaceae bacterium SB0664_bin_27 TaxID=2605260 RepID=A0A6B0YSV9_9CHLR|nr:carbohydrate ABC transporter permease [Caldilineaceae bacterium SB0664_bin_27]